MSKGNLQRETLLRNFERLINRIPTVDLPVTVNAILAFGGILRKKNQLHDCDVLVLYSMKSEQCLRWDSFRDNFSTSGLKDHNRQPIRELKDLLELFYKRNITLKEAVLDSKVASVLQSKGIPPTWAGCFSWTDIFRGAHGDGIFYPDLEKVVRRLLFNKTVKGLSPKFNTLADFVEGKSMLVAKNYVLAWSPEKPDARKNIEGRSPEVSKLTILKELDHFVNNQIHLRRNGSDSFDGYLKVKAKAIQACTEVNLQIDFEQLDQQHTEITWSENDSIFDLSRKCEIARIEMRNYDKEIKVLEEIPIILKRWKKLCNNSDLKQQTVTQFLTETMFERIQKREMKERNLREILRTLKLPEDQVVPIQRYNCTCYRLSKSDADKINLINEAQTEKVRRKYRLAVNKALKSFGKDVSVHLELDEKNALKKLGIEVYTETDEKTGAEKAELVKALEDKGFKIVDHHWAISGVKEANLTGTESIKELQSIARAMLEK
jgi:hypothetical protein